MFERSDVTAKIKKLKETPLYGLQATAYTIAYMVVSCRQKI